MPKGSVQRVKPTKIVASPPAADRPSWVTSPLVTAPLAQKKQRQYNLAHGLDPDSKVAVTYKVTVEHQTKNSWFVRRENGIQRFIGPDCLLNDPPITKVTDGQTLEIVLPGWLAAWIYKPFTHEQQSEKGTTK
jgi:hypothetical protein